MAANSGRTVSRFVNFVISDSGDTLRDVPFDSLGVCGITYEEQDTTAFQDAVKNALPGMPDAPVEVTGPFSNLAAQAASGTGVAPALSGSHTVLAGLNGGTTPRTLDIQFGIQHTWETGEPQFGISGTAANGYICTKYTVDVSAMKYAARFVLYPGSAAPAWGSAAET